MSLIIATFVHTILGTFLTRSGIISSVHAFSEGPIGMYFLAFIAVVLVFSLALVAGRSSELRSEGHLDNMVSRETVFLVNNLLLTAFTFTVLLGTMFPLVAEAMRGEKVSVGAPFFNQMTLPICVLLLFLIGVGPMLPWRVANLDEFKRRTRIPLIALVVTLASALTLGLRDVWGLTAFSFAAWSGAANIQEFVVGTNARRRAGGGSWLPSLLGLIRANPRRYGGYIAHIGLITTAIGMTGSSVLQTDILTTVRPGESIELGGYTVRFDEIWADDQPHRFAVGADLTVLIEGREVGKMDPRLNFYAGRDEPIMTPSVRSRPHKDLYVNLSAFERDGSTATLHVIVEPLVVWIWIGSFIVAFGALVSLTGGRRSRMPPTARQPLVEQEA
jgi:cytochrome c-type biogenesis protein CcmF